MILVYGCKLMNCMLSLVPDMPYMVAQALNHSCVRLPLPMEHNCEFADLQLHRGRGCHSAQPGARRTHTWYSTTTLWKVFTWRWEAQAAAAAAVVILPINMNYRCCEMAIIVLLNGCNNNSLEVLSYSYTNNNMLSSLMVKSELA